MLAINMDDVINVLNSCRPYLIALAVALVLAIVVTVACMKLKKPVKKLVRKEAWIAFLLVAVIVINMICFIPMSSMISLAMGNGTISDETSDEATQLCEDIADEGIVLLKNEDNILPLKDTKNLNVFGWASTNPCYGGTGSGSLSDAYETVSLLDGLKNAGYKLNTELSDFYTDYRSDRPEVGMWAQDWTLPEPTADSYSDEMMKNAKEFSDTAMVVITRVGGEGADLPTDVSKVTYTDNSKDYKDFEAGEHYLQLSQTEKNMLELVCKNFDNVVVVYNGANTMELGFLNDYKQIKGAIWCPGTGQSGFNALGSVVAGEVNPSGKTSDTFVYDLEATPTYNNFGNFKYDNMDDYTVTTTDFASGKDVDVIPSFVNYVEGIYVGYRFYETAAAEGLIDYDKTVQYPFGYGLSYTDFEQKMGDVTVNDGEVSFDVTVTNTGDVAGKDVVEAYYNPPYTNGGIEKASANLIQFAKTDELQPGESQTITISFSEEDMASYSEDGVLAGNMAANAVIGAEKYGVYAYIKHFALNDQETNRNDMVCTWSNEQAIREIYLKPFEIAVKDGGAKAVMSSFNYVGTQWAGGYYPLQTTVLRDEWGFRGFVLTDYFGVYGYMDSDMGIRGGTDCMLVAYDTETNHVTDTKSATSVKAMRQACKNIMYTVVNSRAYDEANLQTGLMNWQIMAIVIDVILGALIIVLEVLAIRKYKKDSAAFVETVKEKSAAAE